MTGSDSFKYAWNGDTSLAYRVSGAGAVDLVYLQGYLSNIELNSDFPPLARFLERLASYSRLIVTDRRGLGCSERFTPADTPSLEILGDDVATVLDAVGSAKAVIFATGGREINTTGDGFLAMFDGPARGVRCAEAIVKNVRTLGIEIRAGLHTGEVEKRGDDVAGLGVVIGARVGTIAGPSEVLVSGTIKDLVVGSGLVFEDAGRHELKGVPDFWQLYRVLNKP